LGSNGWSDLRNPIDTDYPFRMFRDEGRNFIKWLGDADLRQKMQGRLIVVHLVCRDMTVALNISQKGEYSVTKKCNILNNPILILLLLYFMISYRYLDDAQECTFSLRCLSRQWKPREILTQ